MLAAAATLVARRTRRGAPPAISAQQIVDRIRASVGVPWRDTTVDGFKAGDPSAIVTGVATTVMPTLDVLRRAAAARQNLVIAQEPTFFAANDQPGARASDAVYLAKKALIDRERLVVWRFSDHWNARRPNDAVTALAAALGWRGTKAEGLYEVGDTTLGALVRHAKDRLGVRGGLRVIGRLDMRVRTVFVAPGATVVPDAVANLRHADAVLAGEPREWEAVPYVLDTWSNGAGKGMIALGRLVSQTPGMSACALWLRSLVPEVPVETISAADPYWNPGS